MCSVASAGWSCVPEPSFPCGSVAGGWLTAFILPASAHLLVEQDVSGASARASRLRLRLALQTS